MENLKVGIEGSGRHVHLSPEAVTVLFGTDTLPEKRKLTITSAFVYDVKVTLQGPRGKIEGVGVLGPHRKEVQIEVSFTDARILGIEPPIRNSGDTKGSAPITIMGPVGALTLKEGAIVANRHIHMDPGTVEKYGFKDGEIVMVNCGGQRALTMDNVLVRVFRHSIPNSMHVDYDELNAAGLPKFGEVIKKV